MNNRLWWCRTARACVKQKQNLLRNASLTAFLAAAILLLTAPRAAAADAPAWLHAAASAPLPEHDETADAVLLYSERNVTVQSEDKIKIVVREAYKILRPSGRSHGKAVVAFNSREKITGLRGWCIPSQGKDYEVKDKEAIELALPDVDGSELVSDVRAKVLSIPAPDPGNVVGYEYEEEEQPFILQDSWDFQDTDPVREAHYSLQLPPGWEYKAMWLNFPESKPNSTASNQWQWVVNNVKAIRPEDDMPPWRGIAGQMIVSIIPAGGGQKKGFENWSDMGSWENGLTQGRRETTTEIKQKVAELTANAPATLAKMNALAHFVQGNIRYVAIELGIGGWQPHPASEVFAHRYGDCKDKATLMGAMLNEIGVESFYVIINSKRGSVTVDTPAHMGFDHAIIAIKLPESTANASLSATVDDPQYGKLLFFDPTDEMTPLGELTGELQANYGLLVTPDGGKLVKLPQLSPAWNGTTRVAKFTLAPTGALSGDVKEIRRGDRASQQRWALRLATKDTDKIKPVESVLSGSLGTFHLTKAAISNLQQVSMPFGYDYSFVAENYAKNAGDLLLVRPRVLGVKSSALLETKEPRKYPVEFEGPARETDTFEITLPSGYEVDDLPPEVDADYGFASYHSKSEVSGNVLRYTRTFEVKELSVPLNKVEELKKFYRIIASDERNTAVLKPAGKP